jgi:RND family efflux transporter MFP subunit
MKKIIVIIILIAVGIAAGKFLKGQKEAVASLPIPHVHKYSVATTEAKQKKVSQTRHFLAQLLASKSALIASKFSAEIKRVYVKENDIVKKGELLIALDDREIRANVATLTKQKETLIIDLENAKRSLERNKKLLEIEAISQEKYDNANVLYQNKATNLETTKEKIKQTEAQLTYLQIKAPFTGRVGTIFVDAGNLAVPGKPIISLNSDDQKLLFSYVATTELIITGQKVLVDGEVVGEITRKYDDAKNALLVAEIKLSKPLSFANKAFINIDVVIAEQEGCTVPLNSLLHRDGERFVMLYSDKKFVAQKVDVLLEDTKDAVLKTCPQGLIAVASEAKLSMLPSLGEVDIGGEK